MEHIDWPTAAVYITLIVCVMGFLVWLVKKR